MVRMLVTQLAAASLWAPQVLAAGFESQLPFEIFKTAPKRYHQTSPPMDRCGNGLLAIFAESIGLDLSQMPSISLALDASLEDMPTFQEDFDTAMAEMRHLISEKKQAGSSKQSLWEPSLVFSGTWGAHYKIKSAIHSVLNLLKTPVGKTIISEYVENHPEVRAKITELIMQGNLTEPVVQQEVDTLCSDQETGGTCKLVDTLEAEPRLDLNYDLMNMPDVLTGFLTSRLMSRAISEIVGSIITRVDISYLSLSGTANVLMDSPMLNLGSVVCKAADYSHLNDFDHPWAVCGFISLLAAGLGCSESTSLSCSQAHKSPTPDWGNCEKFTAPKEEPVLLNLLPQSVAVVDGDVTAESLELDGRVLYYMWMANLAHTSWSSSQGLCEKGPNPEQLVPGWDRVAEVWSRQDSLALLPAVDKEAVPLAALSRRGYEVTPYNFDPTVVSEAEAETKAIPRSLSSEEPKRQAKADQPPICDFLITQRGTINAYEWDVNFDALQTPNPNSSGAVHRGYRTIADSVVPVFDHWLEKNVFESGECAYEDTKIHITGHSLGGGLAEVYAAHFAIKYAPLGVKVELVTFAPSHGLDVTETEKLRSLANVRSVVGELDMIPEFPCANQYGLPRCDTRRNMIFRGEGQDAAYGEHINPIVISTAELGAINPAYNRENIIDLMVKLKLTLSPVSVSVSEIGVSGGIPGPMNVAGWHVCSYSCWLSSRFCTDDSSLWHMCETCSVSM